MYFVGVAAKILPQEQRYSPTKSKKIRFAISRLYMAVAASGPNKRILEFDWFISGRIFFVLPAQGRKVKKALPEYKKHECIKIKIFDNLSSETVLQTVRMGKDTMWSEVGEEILYEMTT